MNELAQWERSNIIPKQHMSMVRDISALTLEDPPHMTAIQIQNFVLNEMEFPTDFARLQQCKLELSNRYYQLRDLYFQHEKSLLEAQLKNEELQNEKHPIKYRIGELERDQGLLKAESIKSRISAVLAEAQVFYAVFQRHRELDGLPPEERAKKEMEFWSAKALNMPLTFEEKYGPGFLKRAWGDELYGEFVSLRQKVVGLLHKEIVQKAQESLQAPENNKGFLVRGNNNATTLRSR